MTPKGHLPYMTVGVNHQYNTIIIHATLSENLSSFTYMMGMKVIVCQPTYYVMSTPKKRRNFRVHDTNNSLTFPRTLNQ